MEGFDIFGHTVNSQQGDYVRSLKDLIEELNSKELMKPPHQREFVWEEAKVKSWVRTLISAYTDENSPLPVGVIVTYQLKGYRSIYLNDGLQRLTATMKFLDNPEKYKCTQFEANSIVKQYKLPVQHRIYKSQEQAMQAFRDLNSGTSLTVSEICKGYLTYMPDYEQLWKPLIVKLHDIINEGASRLAVDLPKSQGQRQIWDRHDYALFWKFLEKESSLYHHSSYADVASNRIHTQGLDSGKSIEQVLRSKLETLTVDKVSDEINTFRKFVNSETALFESIWFKVKKDKGAGLKQTLYRWLLAIAIWKRNNSIPYSDWEEFLHEFFRYSDGSSNFIVANTTGEVVGKVAVGLDRHNELVRVCKFIGSDFYLKNKPVRKTTSDKLARLGYDQSHLLPFAHYGNGPTIIEPSSKNRSRGASPIEE